MSYSEVVNAIQGDKEKAIKRIVEIANEQEYRIHSIKELQKQIDMIQSAFNIGKKELEDISDHIMHHPPFRIVKKDFIYILNDDFSTEIQQAEYLV